MLRIGIDFDNTMACYDQAFAEVAALMGFQSSHEVATKIKVKQSIQNSPDGELLWQRLQGKVYGKHMLLAKVFAGVHEFICLAKMRGHEVFVVSHKSEFGHFDAEQISLRGQAMLWLEQNNFFHTNQLHLKKENVFFESTREDKIQRIQDLACTHFIDDLPEVFAEPQFPDHIQKILFSPTGSSSGDASIKVASSWRKITAQVLGSWTEAEACQALQNFFPELAVNKAEIQTGRGNSRVYKLTTSSSKNYILKVYPDLQSDKRPRLQTEYAACQELSNRAYPVAKAIAFQEQLGWGIYEWVDGASIEKPNQAFLLSAAKFVQRLALDSKANHAFAQMESASEACLSGLEITKQIEKRLIKLKAVGEPVLNAYIVNEFTPIFETAVDFSKTISGKSFNQQLHRSLQIASPSDFGSHNALVLACGSIIFIDFEYFGWDDPVKLVCDFYWHPGMNLSPQLRQQWLGSARAIFQNDVEFSKRLTAYLPLFGLRWCLIILNEFLKSEMSRRLHANPIQADAQSEICSQQLNKAKALLEEVKEQLHHGSKVQAT
jgi:hypothetical protein